MTRIRIFAAAFAVLIAVTATLPTGVRADVTDKDRTAVEGIVRDYLLAHPEVIREALIELQRREEEEEKKAQAEAVSSASDMLYNSDRQVELGNPKGDITLVEFFDYNCGYCKRALADLMRILEEDKDVRVVLKEFPVLGEGSVEAAQVAVAVNTVAPDKYLAFHQALLGGRGQANRARALDAAEEVGMDRAEVERAMDRPEVRATLEEVYYLANRLGLTGTPSYVVGDEVVMGAVGYDQLKAKLTALRNCGETTC